MTLKCIFLDANVIFSAAYKDASRLALLWEIAGLQLMTSPFALDEARRNLERLRPVQIARFDQLASQIQIVNESIEVVGEDFHQLPAKDVPILAAAIGSGASYLLTGDVKHFGHLMTTTIEGVRVVTPAQFLAELKQQ